jgi:fatty acid desaturase
MVYGSGMYEQRDTGWFVRVATALIVFGLLAFIVGAFVGPWTFGVALAALGLGGWYLPACLVVTILLYLLLARPR